MTLALPRPWVERPVLRWRSGSLTSESDCIAQETPVLMSYNGQNHAVMLATPRDLEDFALGFSLSEGLVRSARDLHDIRIDDHPEGVEIMMTLPEELYLQSPGQERLMTGRTGCGLCGVRTLEQAVRYPDKVGKGIVITSEVLHSALSALLSAQDINQKTGSTHAAAWVTPEGKIQAVREDVGRHNALDKLIGFLARGGTNPQEGFVIITSRASYEMVQKTASFGISLLVAVSGPTSLAVRMANMAGLTLVGFARPHNHVIYTHEQRLRDTGDTHS